MKKITLVTLSLSTFLFSSFSEAGCVWRGGKRVCTPVKQVVVVNPRHYHPVSPWLAFSGIVGTTIIIDKTTGQPKADGKDSIVVETKLIEAGKVDVIEKDNKVIFIKGIG